MKERICCFKNLTNEVDIREEHHQFESILVLEGRICEDLSMEENQKAKTQKTE